MSKSLGNTIAPQEIMDKYGAEIIRLWVSAQDYTNDIRISNEIIDRLVETYRKIRNTVRFIIGNLSDFDPGKNNVAYADMLEIDRYALHLMQNLIEKVTRAYENFEPYAIYQQIYNFCVVDMSSFYLDILKDRLYVYKKDSVERRSAQTALFAILTGLTKLIAPVLSFTAEEIWDYMPAFAGKEESVHLSGMPLIDAGMKDGALAEKWEKIILLRQEVSKTMEQARRDKIIGHPLDAVVKITADGETLAFIESVRCYLKDVFIVSEVEVIKGNGPFIENENFKQLGIAVSKSTGAKCPRCWNYSKDIGTDSNHPEVCARCASQLI
jgi:isoleucyl-tRNA synthetase